MQIGKKDGVQIIAFARCEFAQNLYELNPKLTENLVSFNRNINRKKSH